MKMLIMEIYKLKCRWSRFEETTYRSSGAVRALCTFLFLDLEHANLKLPKTPYPLEMCVWSHNL